MQANRNRRRAEQKRNAIENFSFFITWKTTLTNRKRNPKKNRIVFSLIYSFIEKNVLTRKTKRGIICDFYRTQLVVAEHTAMRFQR